MNIWLINPYGPIPGEGWRDYRFTMLGKALALRGHTVTWWTANFSHHFKRFRSETWQAISVAPNFQIQLVPTTSYVKNISWGRIRFEIQYAWQFYRHASKLAPPDCIVGTDPSQIVGYASVRVAKRLEVPLILDVFDLWPELFVLAFPRLLRKVAPVVLFPLRLLRRYNLRHADAVTALCDTYLEIARSEAPKFRLAPSLTIFNGIDVTAFRESANAASTTTFAPLTNRNTNEAWVVYAGSLGNNYDISTLLHAARALEQDGRSIRFWIAGDGPLCGYVTDFIAAHHLAQTTYLGQLEPRELAGLYKACDIGICAYAPGSNVAMPDKAYDYMAAGLPIVNSLEGELGSLLSRRQLGVQYKAGDPADLADVLNLMAGNQSHRQEMARNSYAVAMEYDEHIQYRKFVDLIEMVGGDRP
jgi:glycosyltransferase involved in cell wall biosynthesis